MSKVTLCKVELRLNREYLLLGGTISA